MVSRRMRQWLVVSALLGLGSCELNPQPPIPARGVDGHGAAGTSSKSGENTSGSSTGNAGADGTTGGALGTAGSLNVGLDDGGDASGGAVAEAPAGGAAADDGGAGGETALSGAGGETALSGAGGAP